MFKDYILIFISLLLILFFSFSYTKLTKLFNLYDFPDHKRKLHKKKISLAGGLLIFISFLFILFIDFFYLNKININLLFINNREFITFLIFSSLFLLIGIYDDKFILSPDKKLFLSFFIVFISLTVNENLLINNVKFSFIEKEINLGLFSYFFTSFAILLFLNSLNMFDGINMQSGLYIIFFLIILFFKLNYNYLFISLIIFLLFFIFLNYKNKIFMGDNGINFLGYILSYFSIVSYNANIINYADEIFLIMCIPGFDLLRLSLTRIFSGKHPFTADNNHIHHKLLKEFNNIQAVLIVMIMVIFPYLFFLIYKNILFSIIISLLLYSSTMIKLSVKKF